MNKKSIIKLVVLIHILTFMLAACSAFVDSVKTTAGSVITVSVTPTFTSTPVIKPVYVTATRDPNEPTATPTRTAGPTLTRPPSMTPTLTLNPTEQTWLSTAVSIQKTQDAIDQQNRDAKATQIADFSISCDLNFYSSSVSPNGEWLAASCGYEKDQTLIVQNKSGVRWVLKFQDFLSQGTSIEMPGSLDPKFWSLDGKYLYFATRLGYSGGGNQCFPGFGDYGLFRLNLEDGSWATLIPPTNSFPGYEIDFSPTGRRYATDIYGIVVTDLLTGEVTRIDAPGVMEFLWSPDGTYLAYSVADCGEQWVETSSVYLWNALTKQTQLLFTVDNVLLIPESWTDNSTLRIRGEQYIKPDMVYTIYIYDLLQSGLLFTGTATPSP